MIGWDRVPHTHGTFYALFQPSVHSLSWTRHYVGCIITILHWATAFSHPPFRDDDELTVFSALSEKSLDDTLIDHDLTTWTDNANDSVPEVYSVFWDNFVYCYCEGASHFTFSVSAALSQDDFVATGRILTHQFIQTGTLPLQISEAIIWQAVVGQVSEECLIQLFLLLHEKERGILQKALLGVQPLPTEDVIEILCDYGITSVPNT